MSPRPADPDASSDDTRLRVADLGRYKFSRGAREVLGDAVTLSGRSGGDASVSSRLIALALADRGEIDHVPFWAGDFLRQRLEGPGRDYVSMREDYLRHRGIGPVTRREPQVFSRNATRIIATAAEHAKRTTGGEQIAGRHLLSAMLDPRSTISSGVRQMLEALRLPLPPLREEFYSWVRGYGDDDEGWRDVLFAGSRDAYALSEFVADDTQGKDLLDIEADVEAFAALISARQVSPPLSIGLFGEWGSGKSFFMRRLRACVARLSQEARDTNDMQCNQPFYKHIVQIEFNAWHYVEGNLWASLMEHLFDHLHIPDDRRPTTLQAMQEHWITQLESAQVGAADAERKKKEAEVQVESARSALNDAIEKHREKADELAELSARSLKRDFQLVDAKVAVTTVLDALGFGPPVTAAANDVRAALNESRAVLERGSRAMTPLVRAPDRRSRIFYLFLITCGAPLLAVGARWLSSPFGHEQISTFTSAAAGIAALLSGFADWMRRQAKWMSRSIQEVERAQQVYEEDLAKAQAETTRLITVAKRDLERLQQAQAAAGIQAAEAQRLVNVATAELAEATSTRLLGRFVQDRASSGDYRKHLGVLALVRNDFQRLSDLIDTENQRLCPDDPVKIHDPSRPARFATLEEEMKEADKRINRIVLYIDDLDRCPPRKVVEVLQAVHLLLAFPLFVVVVGVDARWVARSLESRYSELLHPGTEQHDAESEREPLHEIFGVATTGDYLEKIFQIPFWLRPMEDGTTRLMLNGLLRTDAEQSRTDGASRRESEQEHPTRRGSSVATDRESDSDVRRTTNYLPPSSEPGPARGVERQRVVESLEVRDFELDYMRDLSPLLGRSPRALKRFVNTYRLTKASLSSSERAAFVRRVNGSSDFECVLLLLAIDCGLPALSPVFQEVLCALYSSAEGNGASGKATSAHGANKLVSALGRDERTKDLREWHRVRQWLAERSTSDGGELDFARLARWTSRVARYSFRAPMPR